MLFKSIFNIHDFCINEYLTKNYFNFGICKYRKKKNLIFPTLTLVNIELKIFLILALMNIARNQYS
jgi:hypothetical protein